MPVLRQSRFASALSPRRALKRRISRCMPKPRRDSLLGTLVHRDLMRRGDVRPPTCSTAAAERAAFTSGRPLSQELAEIRCGALATPLPRALFETCEHGAAIDAECLECEPALEPAGLEAEEPHARPFWLAASIGQLPSQTCKRCGATFVAAPRADSTCNLCVRKRAK